MKKFHGADRLGIRDKDTNELIAVYPHMVEEGDYKEIQDKVMFWFYQQSCEAGEKMVNYFVDALTENELRQLDQNQKH